MGERGEEGGVEGFEFVVDFAAVKGRVREGGTEGADRSGDAADGADEFGVDVDAAAEVAALAAAVLEERSQAGEAKREGAHALTGGGGSSVVEGRTILVKALGEIGEGGSEFFVKFGAGVARPNEEADEQGREDADRDFFGADERDLPGRGGVARAVADDDNGGEAGEEEGVGRATLAEHGDGHGDKETDSRQENERFLLEASEENVADDAPDDGADHAEHGLLGDRPDVGRDHENKHGDECPRRVVEPERERSVDGKETSEAKFDAGAEGVHSFYDLRFMIYHWNAGMAGWFEMMRVPEIRLGDFLVPWVMVIGTAGFLVALGVMALIENRGWTREIWNLPVFFLGLFVLVGSGLGLIFAP